MGSSVVFGLWTAFLVLSAALVAVCIALAQPRGHRDWRGAGAFLGFLAALCAEVTLVPMLVYLGWRWLLSKLLGLHATASGHDMLDLMLGWDLHRHLPWLDRLGDIVILSGLVVLVLAWWGLQAARRKQRLATTGVYGVVRHPQYLGYLLVMFGFLLQWPSLLTAIAFAAVVAAYGRLIRHEDDELSALHGAEWNRYAARTPTLVPSLLRPGAAA
jgi:protein-S-isoprenylcysteine O-methyltransferase Ste14